MWIVGYFFVIGFMCEPVEKAWKPLTPGTCMDLSKLWQGSVISSLIIDFVVIIMPLPMLWGLRMKATRKLRVSLVFFCAYLYVISSYNILESITFFLFPQLTQTHRVIVSSIGRLIAIIVAGDSLNQDPTCEISILQDQRAY